MLRFQGMHIVARRAPSMGPVSYYLQSHCVRTLCCTYIGHVQTCVLIICFPLSNHCPLLPFQGHGGIIA